MAGRDTIYAISSGAPPAAIAIVRVSGPAAFAVAEILAGPLPVARRGTLRVLRHPLDKGVLDRALLLVFPAPQTATGEDLVEFHVHGGRAVVAAVLAAIAMIHGTRPAEPGEFTRRALENGVIDLTAAEGLGDLLSASTETQRKAALRMAEGGVRSLVEGWTDRLITIAARIEAQLDFSDEDDVAGDDAAGMHDELAAVAVEIASFTGAPAVERLHEGIRVVLAGPPNAGKSTLLNALAGRDVAIVSAISGTTRDRIEAPVIRAGVAYLLTDTAGLTETPGDEIEAIGVDRARLAANSADIVLWLGDTPPEHIYADVIAVHARSDLTGRECAPVFSDIAVSANAGDDIETLWGMIEARGRSLIPWEDHVSVNARQRELLERCRIALAGAEKNDAVLLGEHVRIALAALDQVTGRSGIEDVLDSVFSRFCIGK